MGDTLYRGPSDAYDALLVGNVGAALAAAGPRSVVGTMIADGQLADARTALERSLFTKWPSVSACQKAYRKAMDGTASPYMQGGRS